MYSTPIHTAADEQKSETFFYYVFVRRGRKSVKDRRKRSINLRRGPFYGQAKKPWLCAVMLCFHATFRFGLFLILGDIQLKSIYNIIL